MKSKKYSVIVFDLGNVLLPFDYEILIKKLNRKKLGLGDKFKQLYADNYDVHRKFERGEMFVEEFLTLMMSWLEGKFIGKEFCKLYSRVFSVNEELVQLLPKLKKKYKLILLSNTNYIHQKYGYGHYDFLKQFDKLFLSYKVGALKPEKRIYKAVEEYTGKPSEEHLFIDDVKEYAAAAKKCGWDAIHFTGNEKLLAEFSKRGIL